MNLPLQPWRDFRRNGVPCVSYTSVSRGFLAIVLLACTQRPPVSALTADQAWWTATSRHFELFTDTSPARAKEALGQLEAGYDMVKTSVPFLYLQPAQTTPEVQWQVILLRNHEEVSALLGSRMVGGFVATYYHDA